MKRNKRKQESATVIDLLVYDYRRRRIVSMGRVGSSGTKRNRSVTIEPIFT